MEKKNICFLVGGDENEMRGDVKWGAGISRECAGDHLLWLSEVLATARGVDSVK